MALPYLKKAHQNSWKHAMKPELDEIDLYYATSEEGEGSSSSSSYHRYSERLEEELIWNKSSQNGMFLWLLDASVPVKYTTKYFFQSELRRNRTQRVVTRTRTASTSGITRDALYILVTPTGTLLGSDEDVHQEIYDDNDVYNLQWDNIKNKYTSSESSTVVRRQRRRQYPKGEIKSGTQRSSDYSRNSLLPPTTIMMGDDDPSESDVPSPRELPDVVPTGTYRANDGARANSYRHHESFLAGSLTSWLFVPSSEHDDDTARTTSLAILAVVGLAIVVLFYHVYQYKKQREAIWARTPPRRMGPKDLSLLTASSSSRSTYPAAYSNNKSNNDYTMESDEVYYRNSHPYYPNMSPPPRGIIGTTTTTTTTHHFIGDPDMESDPAIGKSEPFSYYASSSSNDPNGPYTSTDYGGDAKHGCSTSSVRSAKRRGSGGSSATGRYNRFFFLEDAPSQHEEQRSQTNQQELRSPSSTDRKSFQDFLKVLRTTSKKQRGAGSVCSMPSRTNRQPPHHIGVVPAWDNEITSLGAYHLSESPSQKSPIKDFNTATTATTRSDSETKDFGSEPSDEDQMVRRVSDTQFSSVLRKAAGQGSATRTGYDIPSRGHETLNSDHSRDFAADDRSKASLQESTISNSEMNIQMTPSEERAFEVAMIKATSPGLSENYISNVVPAAEDDDAKSKASHATSITTVEKREEVLKSVQRNFDDLDAMIEAGNWEGVARFGDMFARSLSQKYVPSSDSGLSTPTSNATATRLEATRPTSPLARSRSRRVDDDDEVHSASAAVNSTLSTTPNTVQNESGIVSVDTASSFHKQWKQGNSRSHRSLSDSNSKLVDDDDGGWAGIISFEENVSFRDNDSMQVRAGLTDDDWSARSGGLSSRYSSDLGSFYGGGSSVYESSVLTEPSIATATPLPASAHHNPNPAKENEQEQKSPRSEFRAQVEALLLSSMPQQLPQIDTLIEEFDGRESELLTTLQLLGGG